MQLGKIKPFKNYKEDKPLITKTKEPEAGSDSRSHPHWPEHKHDRKKDKDPEKGRKFDLSA